MAAEETILLQRVLELADRASGVLSEPAAACVALNRAPPLHTVALFSDYLQRRGLSAPEAEAGLPRDDHRLLAQRCLAVARGGLIGDPAATVAALLNGGAASTPLSTPSVGSTGNSLSNSLPRASPPTEGCDCEIAALGRWCLAVIATPDPIEPHNTPERRTHIENPLPSSRTLTEFFDLEGHPPRHLTARADGGWMVRRVAAEDLTRVDDPTEICISHPLTLVGGTADRPFEVTAVAALRKGSAQPPTPKAMGEDAWLAGAATVLLPTSVEDGVRGKRQQEVQVPMVAVLDGGGGHQLAQYGRVHLLSAFQEALADICAVTGDVDGPALHEAMRAADHLLFNRDDLLGAPSEGYTAVAQGHAEVEVATGLAAADLVQQFQRGPFAGLNPMQAHLRATTAEMGPPECLVATPKHTFDLRDRAEAAGLQRLYEQATGTVVRMEVQLVMCAFCQGSDGEVQVITFSRGDCRAVLTSHDSTQLTGLSSPGSSLASLCTKSLLSSGARVTCGSDGHFEKVSLDDHASFDRRAANERCEDQAMGLTEVGVGTEHRMMEGGCSVGEYVEALARASGWVGGGDDTTLLSAQVHLPGMRDLGGERLQ